MVNGVAADLVGAIDVEEESVRDGGIPARDLDPDAAALLKRQAIAISGILERVDPCGGRGLGLAWRVMGDVPVLREGSRSIACEAASQPFVTIA